MERDHRGLIMTMMQNGDACGAAGIYATPVFQTLLRHERARTERVGGEFSIAVFDFSGIHEDGILRATTCIREELRTIDEIGWLDDTRIGVLLPLTSIDGGRRFAARVSESISRHLIRDIPCAVYAFPTHWLPGVGGNGNGKSHESAGGEGGSSGGVSPHAPDRDWLSFDEIFGSIFCRRIPAWKRVIDVAGSSICLLLLSPLLLIVTLYIECVSPGKVLFRQKRIGYKGRPFTFLKFRTMKQDCDSSAHRQYVKELIHCGKPMVKLDRGRDPRIIPGGRILRKACIDELPQLINVLRGEMSLVGPRPCLPYEAEEYLQWHTHRFDIQPGMTGLWQVSGKNRLSFEQMIRLDIAYTNRLSFWQDLKILFLTPFAIMGLVFEAVLDRIRERSSERIEKREPIHDREKPLSNA